MISLWREGSMKSTVNEITVLDAGVLIALAVGEPNAMQLSQKIVDHQGDYACTEIALCELSYILCRRLSWEMASEKAQNLVQSSIVTVIPTHVLWAEAARIKCRASIALPDCFTLAAARLTRGKALFARREREIINAVKRNQIADVIEYLQ
jgi:predicted nucleic acid-binding protein